MAKLSFAISFSSLMIKSGKKQGRKEQREIGRVKKKGKVDGSLRSPSSFLVGIKCVKEGGKGKGEESGEEVEGGANLANSKTLCGPLMPNGKYKTEERNGKALKKWQSSPLSSLYSLL